MNQLQAMRAFVRVADTQSFTRAAEALDTSRAAVSAQIQALERHLGSPLLSRTTRRVMLTADGSAYLERSRRILAEIEAADEEVRAVRARVQGRLRVDMPAMFGRYLLLPALSAFTARYPELALEIQYNERVIDLAAERVDIAVRFSPTRDDTLISRRIGVTRLITCAAPEYLERHGVPQNPEELRRHRLIGQTAATGGRPRDWVFRTGGQQRRLALPCALRFNAIEGALQAALAGLGVLQTADLVVQDLLRRRRLVVVLPGSAVPGSPVSLVYTRAGRNSARVRAFADFAAEVFQSWHARQAPDDGPRPGP